MIHLLSTRQRPQTHQCGLSPAHSTLLAALLTGATLGMPGFAQGADRPTIEDRHGVVLYAPSAAEPALKFPYRALASQVLADFSERPDLTGEKIPLTLNAATQFAAEKALRAVHRGAAVVLDAQSGDILAMASVPSFDPNRLTPPERAVLSADPTAPLTNRAVRAYAPGSTFTTVTGLAIVRRGLSAASYSCAGGVTYGSKYLKCWIADRDNGGGHGELKLETALPASCGAYFYQAGNAAGIEEIGIVGRLLGLGKLSGLGFSGEEAGILPGPEWLRDHSPGERWSAGYTANTAIGQGFTLATPLQMARVAAAVGNGGPVPGLRIRLDQPAAAPVNLRDHEISAEAFAPLRQGLRAVVETGTGKRASVAGIAVAGKTGTAQYWRQNNVKDNHAWFIAYAPADQPKIAVCVLVQGAKAGGSVAAPLAGQIIAQALAVNPPKPEPLDAAKGSFEQVESVGE